MRADTDVDFDPAVVLDQIDAATARLLETAARFTDTDVRVPSLLPDWSRGHVLTHLARNADGGRNLLVWARTGVRTPEYPSLAARAEQIEAGACRNADQLLKDLRDSAARFAVEYRRMPSAAWDQTVCWTGGQQHPAARAADSRLCEVLVHHVDLDAGYTPVHWPADFVQAMLGRVVAAYRARGDAAAMRLRATDTGARHDVGAATGQAPAIHGPQHSLLAWLMGRSQGADLTVQGAADLPEPPFLY